MSWTPRALFAAPLLWSLLAAPALAVTVKTTDSRSYDAEWVFPTVTGLVVVTRHGEMALLPSERVASVDGKAYDPGDWTQEVPSFTPDEFWERPRAPEPAAAQPGQAEAGVALVPLSMGTVRRYAIDESRTTWVRHGRRMERLTPETARGVVSEEVVGPANGHVAVRETIRLAAPTRPAQEIQLEHRLESRPDGTYLAAQTLVDPNLREPNQQTTIQVPPRLWPEALKEGMTWTYGPFQRFGIYQAGRMEVVGRESVTVPSGTYPDAFRVVGFGHVFGGAQQLKAGRLVTQHGTLETTTWFVPGLGPVKEEAKVHLHQAFFPTGQAGFEIPVVVEKRSTRSLTEFQLGAK